MNAVPSKIVIEEAALELGINPAFVEKDWYVVQLIGVVMQTDLYGAQVIFTGGTALSKAYQLLQRFSEDIDFRLVLPHPASMSRGQRRTLLSRIRERLLEVIVPLFPHGAVSWKSRDENRYFAFEVEYLSVVDPADALRPHLQIEFTATTLSLPPVLRSVSSFIAELSMTDPEIPDVACIDPVENAADKLSALLWRVPDRTRVPQDDDPDLTRHLHDLAVLQPYAAAHAAFCHLAIEMIRQDDDRCARTMGLPLEEKARVLLSILDTDGEYRSEYTRFVQGMSYAIGAVPTYDEAMAKLRILIDLLL